jgi:RNA polymerase sigma-70 factor (ECF subfamily)
MTSALVLTSERDEIDILVARAQHGDTASFVKLYDVYGERVYRYVRSRLQSVDDAEDVTQGIFLRMIEALPKYEARGRPFAAWVFRIAQNAIIDFRRARQDEPLGIHEDSIGGLGPVELAEMTEDRGAIAVAMRGLTKPQRDVITYRFFLGLSHAEVAAIMGKREVAVRLLQFRALATLRRALTPQHLTRMELGRTRQTLP